MARANRVNRQLSLPLQHPSWIRGLETYKEKAGGEMQPGTARAIKEIIDSHLPQSIESKRRKTFILQEPHAPHNVLFQLHIKPETVRSYVEAINKEERREAEDALRSEILGSIESERMFDAMAQFTFGSKKRAPIARGEMPQFPEKPQEKMQARLPDAQRTRLELYARDVGKFGAAEERLRRFLRLVIKERHQVDSGPLLESDLHLACFLLDLPPALVGHYVSEALISPPGSGAKISPVALGNLRERLAGPAGKKRVERALEEFRKLSNQ